MVAERLVGPLQVLNGLEEADLVNLARLILKGWNSFDPGSLPSAEWRTLLAEPSDDVPVEGQQVALWDVTDEPVAEGRDQGSRSAEAAVDTEWFGKQKEEVDGFMEWIMRERDLRGVALASSSVFHHVSCIGSRNRILLASIPLTRSPVLSSAHFRGLYGGAWAKY